MKKQPNSGGNKPATPTIQPDRLGSVPPGGKQTGQPVPDAPPGRNRFSVPGHRTPKGDK